MLNLIAVTDKLRAITANATATVDVHVSGVDLDNTTPSAQVFVPFKEPMLTITGAATTDITAVPASSHMKNVKYVSFVNTHASITQTVQVQYDANAVLDMLTPIVTLLAGESLVCREGVWFHFDVNGGVYGPSLPVMSDSVAGAAAAAVQSDMESASSTTLAVTPGRMKYHPGVAKVVAFTTGTTTPALQTPPSVNVSSITDTGVGRLTVTLTTSFSSANWACVCNGVGISTTLTAIALVQTFYIRFATMAAGTVEINARDATATTNALADPSGYAVSGFGDFT